MKEVVTIGGMFSGWVWWVFFGIVGLGVLLVLNKIQMKHEIGENKNKGTFYISIFLHTPHKHTHTHRVSTICPSIECPDQKSRPKIPVFSIQGFLVGILALSYGQNVIYGQICQHFCP